jgi:phage-related tail protein
MALDSANNGEDVLLKTITKLLDKAGKDPRLTPRILREKAEQRMELNKGDLKPKREKIKDIIYDWWKKQKQDEVDKETAILKAVSGYLEMHWLCVALRR